MPPPILYVEDTKTAQWKNSVSAKVVTKAEAQLTSANMNGGSGPSPNITPPGWGTGLCPAHHQRGHLIGNKLGGPGDEAKNLVTLTAGTNHPFMYEFEDAVYCCVSANKGHIFTYIVECDYTPSSYTAVEGFSIHGAAGNPFCLFPAPAFLRLSLWVSGKPVTLGEMVKFLPKPPADLGTAASYTNLLIANGGYKLYTGATHTANSCWAVVQNFATVQAQAETYAKSLGHLT